MTVIEASSVRVRTMGDGTLRAELDFEPAHAVAAFRLLGSPGQPVAVAALKTKAQQEAEAKPEKPAKPAADDKPKGGVWSQWLAIRCGETEFQDWLAAQWPALWAACGDPAEVVRCVCEVASRAEIDNDPEAQARFQERIRGPWAKHYGSARA
jgi:hypothetical protein